MTMHKTQTIPVVAVLALLGAPGETLAAPSGAKLAAGNASVANNQIVGSNHIDTLITLASDRAILDWESFDIAPGELVRFVQNGTDAVTLNRIAGDATQFSEVCKLTGNCSWSTPTASSLAPRRKSMWRAWSSLHSILPTTTS